ncbi:hypothetical protein Q5H93_12275 [Hymenobacter sp. ASUV-10]|uniref:Transposase n=1 Tax=Hymenobacter aranciens TaxID=3063996 RepID=A0ABT9BB66_9BACT|nr:hypothetical protein [Hymenobacter sp. ASUV-10]MDO7875511.1 hypothetical protein [Hymenobacter sp. ASUV-10]
MNSHWLITGEGEPFLSAEAGTTTNINNSKNKGTVQNNTGNHNTINNNVTLEECRRELAASQKDNDHLREQLKLKDELIAAKDETINLLRSSYGRPN